MASSRHLGAATTSGGGPEPSPPPAVQPPGWLEDDARGVWDRLAPVVPDGRLTPATAEGFALLCVALAAYTEADKLVTISGLLVAQGQDLVPAPALAIRDRQGGDVARWLKTYGLTPDSQPPGKPQRPGRPHLVES